MQIAKDHGFADIAPCDLMDEDGDMALPITGGKRLKENFVGKNLQNYDSMLMLSHFKGHPMAGLGGALKNMSIGVASAHGKQWIHTSGSGETSFEALMKADHVGFLESMADADQSVMAYGFPPFCAGCIFPYDDRAEGGCDCLYQCGQPPERGL